MFVWLNPQIAKYSSWSSSPNLHARLTTGNSVSPAAAAYFHRRHPLLTAAADQPAQQSHLPPPRPPLATATDEAFSRQYYQSGSHPGNTDFGVPAAYRGGGGPSHQSAAFTDGRGGGGYGQQRYPAVQGQDKFLEAFSR